MNPLLYWEGMDPYRLLLQELGIENDIPPDSEPTVEKASWNLTSLIDTPCEFTCWDLPTMLPDEELESEAFWEEPEYHLDYDQEMHHAMNYTKKHRYSRKDRFRSTLYQLLGMNGEIPPSVIGIVKRELGSKVKKQKIWNDVRTILKRHKLRRYYNRIPSIIKIISGLKPLGITSTRISLILESFFKFDYHFNDHLKREWKREYFPNLRFIALKLAKEMEIEYPYHVPLIRTSRKKKYLENIFQELKRYMLCV